MSDQVSEIFDPAAWRAVDGFDFTDITYHRAVDTGAVRIAFDRPEVRNAFRPGTVDELYTALDHARQTPDVGCVLLTGNGPSPRDGGWAFCSGGDQRIRGRTGYQYASGETAATVDPARAGRLHILECQRLIRFMPKVVIAVVPGWAAGGGHSLHVVADLTLASAEHARFKQTDADVGSFDGGYGSAYLARQVGQKFAREIFLLGREYSAADAHRMGMVNAVVPHAELETVALEWAREINGKSPTAQRMLKYAFNLIDDGLVGQQLFAGEATRLAYMTDEAVEGRDAFLEKRAAGLVARTPGTTEPSQHPSWSAHMPSACARTRPVCEAGAVTGGGGLRRLVLDGSAAAAAELAAALAGALDGGPAVLPRRARRRIRVAAPAGEPDPGTAVVIMTSGSSGEPKLVQLSAAALRASADGHRRPARRAGALAARAAGDHVAGVQVIVRSLLAGHEPVRAGPARRVPARPVSPPRPPSWPAPSARYTSLVPTQLRPAAGRRRRRAGRAAQLPRGARRRGRARRRAARPGARRPGCGW